jgi:Arc/MetJ-type ribon-helix-helix transcriptional regulator
MPTLEDKIKINARIPKSLYDWIGAKYGNVSQAVNEGLELLRESQSVTRDTEAHKSPQVVLKEHTSQSDTISTELKARLEEKEKQIEEKDRHIETLKTELEKAGQREEDLKETHRNYMLQVQSLINQKAIEAPGAKKQWWRFW